MNTPEDYRAEAERCRQAAALGQNKDMWLKLAEEFESLASSSAASSFRARTQPKFESREER